MSRVGVTYAIQIDFTSTSRDLAAQVANGVADAYINLQRTSENDATRQASAWLETRIPELRAKSEAAQRAVVEYKNEHNIVGQVVNDQSLADLSSKLAVARDNTAKAKARLDQLDAIRATGVPDVIAIGSIASGADNGVLSSLRARYFEITAKEVEFFGKVGS